MPPSVHDDVAIAAEDDGLSAPLRAALDIFYGQQEGETLVSDLQLVANQVRRASTPLKKSSSDLAGGATEACVGDVRSDVQYFLEAHVVHAVGSSDGEDDSELTAASADDDCGSCAVYAQFHRQAVARMNNAVMLLLSFSADDSVLDLADDLLLAITALLEVLAESVPLCVLRDLVHKLSMLNDLDTLVSLVVAMASLAEQSTDAVVNITERCPAELWLLYVRWFAVVEHFTDEYPWFGTNEGCSFWLSLRAVCSSTDSEVELLSLLEALVQQPREDGRDDAEGTRAPPFTLAQLASYLIFFTGPSKTPFEAADLPRLSRQTRRWCRIQDACIPTLGLDPTKRSEAEYPEFALAQCLYYVEHLEQLLALDVYCSGPEPEARAALEQIDLLVGPTGVTRTERAITDLSVEDVVASLRAAQSLTLSQLQHVEEVAHSILNARGHAGESASVSPLKQPNSSLATLIKLDMTVRDVYRFALYPVQLVAVVCATCGGQAESADAAAAANAIATRLAVILQMETGEGKSVVFAVIASFFALQDKYVDVATSSGQLAGDGDRDAAPFFDALKISHSSRSEASRRGNALACYESQVVYGTVSEFAGDYLRDLIFGDDGRGDRSFDILLLDEVDATLVDGAGNLTMLSMAVPGMDRLYFMYGAVLRTVKRTMELENDSTAIPHYTDPEFRAVLGLPRIADADATAVKSEPDAGQTIANAHSVSTAPPQASVQVIPKCLLSMCDKKLQVYIEHAWGTQTWCRQGRQYDVTNGEVVVIDNRTSGEYQNKSVYSEGLHQFLQIEHGCRLIPESLNSVFLSNGAFARRYAIVIGITGTIGPVRDQQAMSKALDNPATQFAALPRSKHRPYVQLPPLVLSNSTAWRTCWLEETQRCVRDQRPVLLIFVDKETACREAEFLETHMNRSVQRYIINDAALQTFSASNHKLAPGEIVVSTTFGSRGTDYKLLPAAEANGGLHTVLTFYASSVRVIDQAFGRSARAGSPGSGALVTVDTTLMSDDLFARRTEEQVTRARDYKESLSEQLKTNLPLNESCDQLFRRFSDFYAKLREHRTIKGHTVNRVHFLRAVRDRFGLLIEELRHDVATRVAADATRNTSALVKEHATAQYNAWFRAVATDFKAGDRVITNERAMVVYARDLPSSDVKQALDVVTRAIAADAAFVGPAGYVLRLKFTLEKRKMVEKKRFKPRSEADYTAVKILLVETQDAFTAEIEFVGGEHELLIQDNNSGSSLNAQLTETMNLLFILRDAVSQSLAVLEAEYAKRGKDDDDDKFYLTLQFIDFPDDVSAFAQQIYKETLHPNGYLGPMQLAVEREWVWDWNAFGAMMLGIGQAIGGALAMVFSAGAYGMGLIAEGISDIVSGINSMVKGDGSFSWSEYFTSKALSLAVSLVCSGICKVGKALWKAGKAFAQRGVTLAKSAWKNGLRTALKTTQKATTTVAAQQTAKEATRAAIIVSRDAFKQGLVKCGTQLGSHVAKQVLISGVNFATDEGIRAAFNALEAEIDNLVKEKIGKWVDGAYGRKMERLHHMFLMDRRSISAIRLITERSKATLSRRQQAGHELLEQFGRMLADAVAESMTHGLENSKHCVLALCVKGLTEGLKWAEMSVQVAQFVDLWIGIVADAIDDEMEHLTCVDATAAATSMEQWNTLVGNGGETFALHASADRVHWRPKDRSSVETLAASTTLEQQVLGVRLHITDAVTKLQIDSKFQARGVVWTSLRGMLVADVANVATAFIRGKIERRTAQLSKCLAAYGTRKLVDSTVNVHLQRKAGKLLNHETSNEAEAAAHDARVDRFLQDNVVAKRVQNVLGDVRGDGPASLAVLQALARQDDVPIVIHHENGDEIVLNASGSQPPMHFDESGAGKLLHLVPRETGDEHESFEDTAAKGDKSCLYRAYFFHKLGRNGTDAEIAHVRKVITEGFASDLQTQLDLYNQRKPKRVYGANKGKNSIKVAAQEARRANEGAAAAKPRNGPHAGVQAIDHDNKHFIVSSKNSYFRVAMKRKEMNDNNVQKHIGYMVQFVASRKGEPIPSGNGTRVLDFDFNIGRDANGDKLTKRIHYDYNHGHPNQLVPNNMRESDIPTVSGSEFCDYIRSNREAYAWFINNIQSATDLKKPEMMENALSLFERHVM